MALTPADYYVLQADLDSKIDSLIPTIDSNITTLEGYLNEDITSKYISTNSTDRADYNNLKITLTEQFKQYASLGGLTKYMTLLKDIIEDRANGLKTMYILEDIRLVNYTHDNNSLV